MNVKESVLRVLEENRGKSVSGAELAKELGVSRNAVWKAVKTLQEQGITITGVTNKGYCLAEDNDILTAEKLVTYLKPEYKKLPIEIHKEIGSTNDRAKELAEKGCDEGTVIIAMHQTAGKGRRGRSFYSPDMSGVYMTFVFRPAFSVEQSLHLTTAAAVAAAKAIEDTTGIKAGIKWVNDVFCHEKKVCGILTEASINIETGLLDYAVTGIGFNISEPAGGFPEEIKEIAGAIIRKEDKVETSDIRSRLAAEMINNFMEYYDRLLSKTYMDEYRKRSFLLGKEIYTLTQPPVYGKAVDIDDDGHLILELSDGSRQTLSSGEVSVRPIVT